MFELDTYYKLSSECRLARETQSSAVLDLFSKSKDFVPLAIF
jgi:hypothetical protein